MKILSELSFQVVRRMIHAFIKNIEDGIYLTAVKNKQRKYTCNKKVESEIKIVGKKNSAEIKPKFADLQRLYMLKK